MLRGAPDEDEAARPHIHPIPARHTVPRAPQVLRDVGTHFDHDPSADFGRFEDTGVDRGGAHGRVISIDVRAPHRLQCAARRADKHFPPPPLPSPCPGAGRPGDPEGGEFMCALGRGRKAGLGRRLIVGRRPARSGSLRRLRRRRRHREPPTQKQYESRKRTSGEDCPLKGREGNHPSLR